MKTIPKQIKSINKETKLPKGWNYLTSWDCEYLLRNNFELFKKLEKYVYYKLNNPTGGNVYLWVRRVGYDSFVSGSSRCLYDGDAVRGVLIWK